MLRKRGSVPHHAKNRARKLQLINSDDGPDLAERVWKEKGPN
jgi:hypothetical protein